jgi:hypothetical protein
MLVGRWLVHVTYLVKYYLRIMRYYTCASPTVNITRTVSPLCARCVLRRPVLIRDNLHVTHFVNRVYVRGFDFGYVYSLYAHFYILYNVLLYTRVRARFIRPRMSNLKIGEQFFFKNFSYFLFRG